MTTRVTVFLLGAAVCTAALTRPVQAQSRRPTPHQAIEQALAPLAEQLRVLNATEAERADVADVLARSEALASAQVEARHQGAAARAESLGRRLAWLARTVRGRIEAARSEASAGEGERAALAAEDRRVQARAALERAVERRAELDRAPGAGADDTPPAPARPARGAPAVEGSLARPATGAQ